MSSRARPLASPVTAPSRLPSLAVPSQRPSPRPSSPPPQAPTTSSISLAGRSSSPTSALFPLDHDDSNYALLKKELLDKIPEGQKPTVHTINTEHLNDLQELADEYEQTLVASFASRDSVRLPIFDLLLLGCGPDGHTCSLFPGHPLLRETSAWVAPIDDSPQASPKRITLTLPVVNHAVRVAFVATGGGKKDIMKQIFDTNGGLPCTLVNESTGERCSWFVDEPAVEGVSFPRRAFL
ncbi:suppressor of los1-1 [Fusarium falciforme]|nr:suppressor of los1-1 [Fusarium falciforme]